MTRSVVKSLVFLLVFLSAVLVSAAQVGTGKWTYSNPKPFGFYCNQITYANDNNALVVGDAGGIAKTTDGGATWSYFSYTTHNIHGDLVHPTFQDVQYVNQNLVFAVGGDGYMNNGIMIKSIDGGTNWTEITTPFYAADRQINTVFFTDASTGYIGGYGDAVTRKTTLYKTTDGGNTWQPEFVFPEPVESWLDPGIYKIRFAASGVGYVGGANGLVWKYENGTWSDYSLTPSTLYTNVAAIDTVLYDNYNGGFDSVVTTYADNIGGLSWQNYRGIAIINDTAVVVSSWNNGGLVRINTSGATGSYLLLNNGGAPAEKYAPVGNRQMNNLACRDGSTVAGVQEGGKFMLSKDKGFTWSLYDVYPVGTQEAGLQFNGIDISPSGRIGICGAAGIIADSSTQWRRPYKYVKANSGGFFGGYGMTSVSFADANYGMVAGSGGTILRTADGGNNWEDVSNSSFSSWDVYNSIQCISPNVILAAASNGQFYKSLDRATSFDLLFTEPYGANLQAMHFINEDTGWMIANRRYPDNVNFVDTFHQVIYHTYDGGLTWDTSNTVLPYETDYSLNNVLNEIKFFNAKIGYTGGDNGTLYKTTDGGINWVKQTNLPGLAADKPINSIAVVDENTAFVSGGINMNTGEGGLIMKTVDGGNTWTLCNTGLSLTGSNNRFPKVLMYDASQGLLFSTGTVYSTLDGGASWTPYYAPLNDLFQTAGFAPMAGCTTGICKKVFAAGFFQGKIMKLDADVVLPVKFSKLTGTGTQEGNQLFWTAFSQDQVSYFEIEHSADGSLFKKIGDKVFPGPMEYESYQWLDANAQAGKNFYRIKAVEKSGAVFYTNIVMIATRKPSAWNYAVSNGALILNNAKVQKGKVTATLIGQSGQLVAAKSWQQNGGAFNQLMLLPPAVKGIHFVKIENEGTAYSFRILIQ